MGNDNSNPGLSHDESFRDGQPSIVLHRNFMSKPSFFFLLIFAAFMASSSPSANSEPTEKAPLKPPAERVPETAEVATFAGGCFWCVEEVFHQTPGIYSAISGYIGDDRDTATYPAVCSGQTNHAEAVQVHFDPKVLSYEKLLDVFWSLHDPTQLNSQGPDHGRQYRSGIYYYSEEQKKIALASKEKLEKSGKYGSKPVVTEVLPAKEFYPAEGYHQNYARTNPQNPYLRYQLWPKLKKLGLTIPTGQNKEAAPEPEKK